MSRTIDLGLGAARPSARRLGGTALREGRRPRTLGDLRGTPRRHGVARGTAAARPCSLGGRRQGRLGRPPEARGEGASARPRGGSRAPLDRTAAVLVRLGELLGLQVRTESGEALGRVHDVRAELTSSSLRRHRPHRGLARPHRAARDRAAARSRAVVGRRARRPAGRCRPRRDDAEVGAAHRPPNSVEWRTSPISSRCATTATAREPGTCVSVASPRASSS